MTQDGKLISTLRGDQVMSHYCSIEVVDLKLRGRFVLAQGNLNRSTLTRTQGQMIIALVNAV